MSKTKGSKNYFQGSKFYKLNSLLGYLQEKYPTIQYPQSWETGGGLNDLVRKLGFVPEIDNGIPGRGHMTKYKGTTMQKIAKSVRDYLKDTTPKKPRLTPIEVANKEAQKQKVESLVCRAPTPEELEELKNVMQNNEPLVLKPLEESVPKGFIELHGAAANERTLIRVADIQEVFEVLPGARMKPSAFFDPDQTNAKTVLTAKGVRCFLETYEEVIEKMRKASEV